MQWVDTKPSPVSPSFDNHYYTITHFLLLPFISEQTILLELGMTGLFERGVNSSRPTGAYVARGQSTADSSCCWSSACQQWLRQSSKSESAVKFNQNGTWRLAVGQSVSTTCVERNMRYGRKWLQCQPLPSPTSTRTTTSGELHDKRWKYLHQNPPPKKNQ